jgi:hypothetical protein
VFGYDSVARRWRSLLVDSLESARRIGLRDITGDGHEEIVIGLASGGNDPVASSGMNVYSAHGDGLRRVFRSTWQDPHIDTLEGISGPVITMRRELWPLFAPRADALVYIDDVFGYRDGRFRSVLAEASQYFRSRAERSVAAYGPLRTAVVAALDSARRAAASRRDSIVAAGATEMPEVEEARDSLSYDHELRLFQTTALVVLNRSKAGDMRGARAFWMQQRQFLRSVLPPEQFDELATFCERLIIGG